MRKAGMQGFTLVELLVVIAIVAILTVTAAVSFTSPSRKLKNTLFLLRNDLNLARSEAVNRGRNIYIDFVNGAAQDSYFLWEDTDNTCTAAPDNCTYIAGDTIIKPMVNFPQNIQYYDAALAGGPPMNGGENPQAGSNGIDFDAGTDDSFYMKPDGTSGGGNGTVFIYATDINDHSIISAAPMFLSVFQTTGKVQVKYWNKTSATWNTK